MDWQQRPAREIVEPTLTKAGRAGSLRFLAASIGATQAIDPGRLAVNDIPSERRFRVVGGIYSAVTPFGDLLCISIDRRNSAALIDDVLQAGGRVTDEPGSGSAVPHTVQLGVPQAAVDRFADALLGPHRRHLAESIAFGPPTWRHRHDADLMRYILAQATSAGPKADQSAPSGPRRN